MQFVALQSEFSFKRCFYHLERLVKDAKARGDTAIGIADYNNTFAHIRLDEYCKKEGIKPIFGVRLQATEPAEKATSFRNSYNSIIDFLFIARNDDGLKEIYRLVNKAYDQFYYAPRLTYDQIFDISDNVFVFCDFIPERTGSFYTFGIKNRINGYTISSPIAKKNNDDIPYIITPTVKYPTIEDSGVYQLLANKNMDVRTYSCHLPSEDEIRMYDVEDFDIFATDAIAIVCNANIQHDTMVKYPKSGDVRTECIKGAIHLNIDLDDDEYKTRLEHELALIEDRDFQDYFLIVADILSEAKKTSLVGPGRGSSGGSLVCYLMGITTIDPIKYGLLFERFIDINRTGLPDIDTDIPDNKRVEVIKYTTKMFGKDNVRSIGTVSKLKPKSAIDDFSKALGIPAYDVTDIKGAIIDRSHGDARASMCIADTFEDTNIGKIFIKQYPEMRAVEKIEGHARHAAKHAAGVIVSNHPLYDYCGIDSRDSIVMAEFKQAEEIGLLKIDILGLRTLAVLEETAKLADYDFKLYYDLELNDQATFDIFNESRFYGLFQFEGKALGILTKQMGVENFNDLCAITSLGRPGALNTGGAARYVKYRTGAAEPEWLGGVYDEITSETYGVVIYQEQTMKLLKDYGNLSWEDVNTLRRAISKSYGDEFFGKYKEKFIAGAAELGYAKENAVTVWDAVASMGSYGFNKSHAVAYSMISYWTAWCKAHHPLEFAAANLNHAKDSENAVKILRDFVVNDDIKFVALDPDKSDMYWTIHDGALLGGLTNLDMIGPAKARKIIKTRNEGGTYTPAIAKKLINPVTPFDILFPTDHYFGKLYSEPNRFGLDKPPSKISDVNEPGDYVIIGKVIQRDLRDRNDTQSILKRGYEVDENQFYLNLYVEDDTDSIKCMIPPFAFEDMGGQDLAEKSIPGETWYLIKGKVRDQWRSISITDIINLKEAVGTEASNAKKDI